jgi:hypothetical protein
VRTVARGEPVRRRPILARRAHRGRAPQAVEPMSSQLSERSARSRSSTALTRQSRALYIPAS